MRRNGVQVFYEVMVNSTGSISEGAKMYYAKQDRLEHAQLSPRSRQLAVWADAAFINAEVTRQLPSHAQKVSLT